jgi:hypothetical protein
VCEKECGAGLTTEGRKEDWRWEGQRDQGAKVKEVERQRSGRATEAEGQRRRM